MNESFRTEIETLQAINHMNLVGFYGYLLFEDEKIIVVECVPNGNLREHLECTYFLSLFVSLFTYLFIYLCI